MSHHGIDSQGAQSHDPEINPETAKVDIKPAEGPKHEGRHPNDAVIEEILNYVRRSDSFSC